MILARRRITGLRDIKQFAVNDSATGYHRRMNFLAHLFLADDDELSLVGNLMGDFVKGRLENIELPEAVIEGVRLHRLIDSYTDAHPRVHQSKQRFPSARRRYAGIVVDMLYDHFLALHWGRYRAEPLPQFAARAYRALLNHQHILPAKLLHILPYMIEDDWLCSYQRFESSCAALDRMARRLRRPEGLFGAGNEAAAFYGELEADFLAFFPDLIEFAESARRKPAPIQRP